MPIVSKILVVAACQVSKAAFRPAKLETVWNVEDVVEALVNSLGSDKAVQVAAAAGKAAVVKFLLRCGYATANSCKQAALIATASAGHEDGPMGPPGCTSCFHAHSECCRLTARTEPHSWLQPRADTKALCACC